MRKSNYDKFPAVAVPQAGGACVVGWEGIASRLRQAVAQCNTPKTILAIECYPGVSERQILAELELALKPAQRYLSGEALLSPAKIDALIQPFLGGDDPVFGFMNGLELPDFFEPGEVARRREEIKRVQNGLILVIGCGATLICDPDILVYADLSRWEAQNRFRRGEADNLGAPPSKCSAGLRYKRAFFIDWRVADRWKRPLIAKWDFVLDTNASTAPKLAEGEAVRRGLDHAVTRPFRVVPFFDPAPWGGQWMKEVCDLDRSRSNYGWCFDCVPEENSLLLDFGNACLELPSIDLVFRQPQALLGEAVHGRFGDEFPIRFDFLDTMGGGNLSFQVHPLTEYIQQRFGMHYSQDESYYILDAGPDASVYLGLRENIDRAEMARALRAAQNGGAPFAAERYANKWGAKKHDHFLIPAGTVHCSGAGSMVLEISATPYIFTFKMWDWGRLGLDGKPRPIHLDHGLANIQWDRTTAWVKEHLVNRVQPLSSGDGWREERTGLHAREFIETRRHWFTKTTPHLSGNGVNVLNLIEGDEAIVVSSEDRFEPFVVHYAETFIVPAQAGAYTIRPATIGQTCATIKAYVRTQA